MMVRQKSGRDRPAALSLLLLAITTQASTPPATAALVRHLHSLGAPLAASRIDTASTPVPQRAPAETAAQPRSVCLPRFSVPPERVELISSATACAALAEELKTLLDQPETIAFDAEWLPDVPTASNPRPNHRPSLLQLATPARVWLLDLEQPPAVLRPPLDAFAALLASTSHRVLGFGMAAVSGASAQTLPVC